MLDPKVIVADEPVSALDVSIRSQVLNLMKRLQAEHGTGVGRDLPRPRGRQVPRRPDRRDVPRARSSSSAAGEDIYERPAHPYTDGLIKTIPLPDPSATRDSVDQVAVRGELPSPHQPAVGLPLPHALPARARSSAPQEEPLLRAFGPGHVAACHFPLQEPAAAVTSDGRAERASGPAALRSL